MAGVIKMIFSILFIILVLFILIFYGTNYILSGIQYYYILDSVETTDKRYSLYNDIGLDGNIFLIVEQDTEYTDFQQIDSSDISLILKTGNEHNRYLYHYIPFEFVDNVKLELLKDRYVVFTSKGKYYFLYDIELEKSYYDKTFHNPENEKDFHLKILNIINRNEGLND